MINQAVGVRRQRAAVQTHSVRGNVMRNIAIISASVTALAAIPFASTAHATVYNAVADFSTSSNPNGAWAYGQGIAGSTFTALTGQGTHGTVAYWNCPACTLTQPTVGEAYGSALVGTTYFAPLGVLYIHPGQSNDVLVQWTAPEAGNYAISGSFEILDESPTGIIGKLYAGGTQLYARTLTGPGANLGTLTPGGSESFSQNIYLSQGEIVTFAVNNDGNFLYDSAGLTATISPSVPEPSTWAMMVLGFAGLGLAGYRKAKTGAIVA
jgi:hypothetical protein